MTRSDQEGKRLHRPYSKPKTGGNLPPVVRWEDSFITLDVPEPLVIVRVVHKSLVMFHVKHPVRRYSATQHRMQVTSARDRLVTTRPKDDVSRETSK